MIDRRALVLASLAAGVPMPAGAAEREAGGPDETIELWPHGVPDRVVPPLIETIDERSHDPSLRDRAVHGITRPRLAVFKPARPNGAAALVMPGGGYRWVVVDKEGYEIARWLAARGWTVFVLFYRLPGEGWANRTDVALADAQRAMRVIRARAGAFGIRGDRVAAMGFSAGGHVCGDLATRFDVATYPSRESMDRLSARPDIAAPIYAVQSMTPPLAHPGSRALLLGSDPTADLERRHSPAQNVTAATPPCFLLHAEDDTTVPVDNTLDMRAALKRHGVAVDTHLFAQGGHGFGLRLAAGKAVEIWPELFAGWARAHGFG